MPLFMDVHHVASGVTEADVIASLESGDLKGKRIGSQWRLTRAALADFLKGSLAK